MLVKKPNAKPSVQSSTMSRRTALRAMGAALSVSPIAHLLGCDSTTTAEVDLDASTGQDASSSTQLTQDAGMNTATRDAAASSTATAADASVAEVDTTADSVETADTSTTEDASTATTSEEASIVTDTGWASGGTAGLIALASYPDPFADETLATCTPTCQMTLGPCHDDQTPEREDISEGEPGLPMRFGLRIVDDNCTPITDANVDIWHCDVRGVYSSETADNPAFCTGDDAEALAARYFRGNQMTDENGVAWFNTCFPGWYNGRAIHVHFTVHRSSLDGDEYLTSQVAFPTSLITEVCDEHPDYVDHGQPNTPNDADSVFPSDSVDDYVMGTEQMSDGALLAWKTIVIRSSLSDSVCSTGMAGGGGGMGMGGMPPGGF